MEMKDGPQGPAGPLDLITYCPRHATSHPELSGIKLAYDHEEDTPEMLFNRQPYPEARAVGVAVPQAGCARAQVFSIHHSMRRYGCQAAWCSP